MGKDNPHVQETFVFQGFTKNTCCGLEVGFSFWLEHKKNLIFSPCLIRLAELCCIFLQVFLLELDIIRWIENVILNFKFTSFPPQ